MIHFENCKDQSHTLWNLEIAVNHHPPKTTILRLCTSFFPCWIHPLNPKITSIFEGKTPLKTRPTFHPTKTRGPEIRRNSWPSCASPAPSWSTSSSKTTHRKIEKNFPIFCIFDVFCCPLRVEMKFMVAPIFDVFCGPLRVETVDSW